jgi:hypothetical protein
VSKTRPKGYVRRKGGAIYADVSVREPDDWRLKRGLPYYRVSRGLVLIALDDIDDWLQQFKVENARNARIDELVEEIVDDVLDGDRGRQ